MMKLERDMRKVVSQMLIKDGGGDDDDDHNLITGC